MAQHKNRRAKQNRQRPKTPSPPPQPPAVPAPATSLPSPDSGATRRFLLYLRRLPSWIYYALSITVIGIALLQGWPWLSIVQNGSLDPKNPYSTKFNLTNIGYIPVYDIYAICKVTLDTDENSRIINTPIGIGKFSNRIGHGDFRTIPCFQVIASISSHNFAAIGVAGNILHAEFEISILYSFFPHSPRALWRHQSFNFKGVRNSSGYLEWIFVD